MKTEIKTTLKPRFKPLEPDAILSDFAANNGQWLIKTAREQCGADGVAYALIHADDGVIWAKVAGDALVYPPTDDWTPELRTATIQQCRLFGDKGELFIWRTSDGEVLRRDADEKFIWQETGQQWRGRIVSEEEATGFSFEERQVLYGSRIHKLQPAPTGFTPIFEPTTGIRQIVPLAFTELKDNERVTLTVVNYLEQDDDGQARICCSRLKSINAPEKV